MSNILTEKTALGCLLSDSALAKETILNPDCFQNEYNRIIFNAIDSLSKKESRIDTVTVAEEIGPDNLHRIGGYGYVYEVYNSSPNIANFEQYEKILVEEWKKRQAIILANTLKDRIVNEEDDAITVAVKEFSDLDEYGHKHTQSKREILTTLHESISNRDGSINGIQTGFTLLDRTTFGFKPGQFIIFGGRPAMGKTAGALCLAINAAMLGTSVTYFSLEMSEEELFERGVSALSKIPSQRLRNPKEKFEGNDWQEYNKAFGTLERIPLEVVNKSGATMKYVRSIMRKQMRENPNTKHMCVIDYVQLMHGNKRLKRHEEVAEIARGLKELARDLKMPVVALSQLSRDISDRQDKRPVMSDLRESGELEQSADIIVFLHRPGYYDANMMDKTLMEFIVSKHRGGSTGIIPMKFIDNLTLVTNREGS